MTPPNGRRGSDLTTPLTKTEPNSIAAASAAPLAAFAVQIDAPSPKRDRLASSTACRASLALTTAPTGPNVSSSNAGIPGSTPARTVGA